MEPHKAFGKKKPHPLGWGDRELAYLIAQGLDNSNLYRAMGYKLAKGNSVPKSFRDRVYALLEQKG